MYFKDTEKKFSGGLTEYWMDFVDDYAQISIDYRLSERQKKH